MKALYIDLMEKILSAYTNEHILRYFNQVKTEGLTEHGFPRLTSNIGILISNGKRKDLLSIFSEMMEFCCKTIPCVKAANDFSVREIINCLEAVENSKIIPSSDTDRWREYLKGIKPEDCYNQYARTPDDPVRNWALFTGVSEFFRQKAGLCHSEEFIDIQIASQFKWIDENGMYMDNSFADVYQPMVYDLVPRGLFSMLLHAGYRGKYYDKIDAILRKAALLTLDMQSVSGEIAFGGRSNQFLHNEGWLALIYEYEANRYKREGNLCLYEKFKSGVSRAVENIEYWLSKEPISHIKNRFPIESFYGCENYAYFDKYMISAASMLHGAYLISDGEVVEPLYDGAPNYVLTSRYFHKLFMKCADYSIELDTNADPHYDSTGLGRVHRLGAPTNICMSQPAPSHPGYTVDIESAAVSFSSGVRQGESISFFNDSERAMELVSVSKNENSVTASFVCPFSDGISTREEYILSEKGVDITVQGDGEIFYMLPAFFYDGERYTEIIVSKNVLEIHLDGWICRYTSSSDVFDTERMGAARNGHYKAFAVSAKDKLKISIEIIKQ